MSKQIYSLIGLCRRSGQLSSGSTLIDDIRNHRVHFVLIANDASDNTKKKITDKCQFYHVAYCFYGDIQTLSNSIGTHRVAVGIKDLGFTNKLKLLIGG